MYQVLGYFQNSPYLLEILKKNFYLFKCMEAMEPKYVCSKYLNVVFKLVGCR